MITFKQILTTLSTIIISYFMWFIAIQERSHFFNNPSHIKSKFVIKQNPLLACPHNVTILCMPIGISSHVRHHSGNKPGIFSIRGNTTRPNMLLNISSGKSKLSIPEGNNISNQKETSIKNAVDTISRKRNDLERQNISIKERFAGILDYHNRNASNNLDQAQVKPKVISSTKLEVSPKPITKLEHTFSKTLPNIGITNEIKPERPWNYLDTEDSSTFPFNYPTNILQNELFLEAKNKLHFKVNETNENIYYQACEYIHLLYKNLNTLTPKPLFYYFYNKRDRSNDLTEEMNIKFATSSGEFKFELKNIIFVNDATKVLSNIQRHVCVVIYINEEVSVIAGILTSEADKHNIFLSKKQLFDNTTTKLQFCNMFENMILINNNHLSPVSEEFTTKAIAFMADPLHKINIYNKLQELGTFFKTKFFRYSGNGITLEEIKNVLDLYKKEDLKQAKIFFNIYMQKATHEDKEDYYLTIMLARPLGHINFEKMVENAKK